ncbi:hypothetical protein [Yinghuangia seranimata]|uniref:hypothetical protein n=1 Tax=Yinghuangia seranimata TaxID=408067 RepID=UPI00248C9E2F|nr:hypothetical protein [Yinghuangia seranimata]MDI2129233.1 hypothetical protein [Yinghuangia seranimata]
MSGDDWIRVPVGPDAAERRTVRPDRLVLAAVRTTTCAYRLIDDVLPLLAGDRRVETVFTVVPGSAYEDAVAPFLRACGARVLPWEQAVATRFDLALTASANGDLHRLDAPVIVMPHGAGHSRRLRPDDAATASGLAAEQLTHDGRVVPRTVLLGHREQRARLERLCPDAAPRAVVVGDPCLDRMRAGAMWRDRYRAALGVGDHQRLVLVTATWGPGSQLRGRPALVDELLAVLPADDFRVALVQHPNVWEGHGAYSCTGWLTAARESGLVVLPPRDGWRAGLVASDLVVGDHGSVTLYAAALGRPVLLAGFDPGEVTGDSPMAELARKAPVLASGPGLREHVEDALRNPPPVRTDWFDNVDGAHAALRTVLYDVLGLAEPPGPAAVYAVARPEARIEPVHTHRVHAHVEPGSGVVRIERFPARLADPYEVGAGLRHLVSDVEEPVLGAVQSADVLLHRGPAAPDWAARALADHPGARFAAVVAQGCDIRTRGGARIVAHSETPCDPTLFASLAYALTLGGRQPLPAEAVLHVASDRVRVAFTSY